LRRSIIFLLARLAYRCRSDWKEAEFKLLCDKLFFMSTELIRYQKKIPGCQMKFDEWLKENKIMLRQKRRK